MSKEKVAVNESNFKSKVAGIVRSGKSIRSNIQELMLFAIVFYLDPKNNGNTSFLTTLYQGVAGVKSLNHRLLGDFIEDTCNVKLRNTKEGDQVFRKATKGDAPTLLEGADLTANWWEHGRTNDPKAVDILKRLASDIKALESTQGDEAKKALVAGQEVCVNEVITRLQGALAVAQSMISQAELSAACPDPVESDDVVEVSLSAVA